MTPQIPYGEAWLLETLAMLQLSVSSLTRDEQDMREWLNCGFHGLSPADLQRTLRRLFDAGDIEAFFFDPYDFEAYNDDDEIRFNPSNAQLEAALSGEDKKLWCVVSNNGGMRWESLAGPNWDRYFESSWDEHCVEITAGSRERFLEVVNGSVILFGAIMDATSLEIECVRPWKPLEWKSLPVGFRASVPYEEVFFWKCEEIEYLQLHSWATSICGRAYVL